MTTPQKGNLRESLKKIREEASKKTLSESAWKELEDLFVEREGLHNSALSDFIGIRKSYAGKIFIFLCIWSLIIIILMVLQGFKIWQFCLPESTLNVLLGTTTINVLALAGIVAKGLFPSSKSS